MKTVQPFRTPIGVKRKGTHAAVLFSIFCFATAVADSHLTKLPIRLIGVQNADALVGTWIPQTRSDAHYTISKSGTKYFIECLDTYGHEQFWMSGWKWDGKTLSGASVLPSNHHTNHESVRLNVDGALEGGGEVWLRQH